MINENVLELFFSTMYERQEIFYKKNILKDFYFDLTEDEILKNYKFCNVYRELDRNSQYLIKTTLMNNEISLKTILLRIMIFRIYNKIDTFEIIGDLPIYESFDLKDFQNIILILEQENYQTANTSSYLVNTWLCKDLSAGVAYSERILPSMLENIDIIHENLLNENKNHKKLINSMKEINGIGNFISYEWFLDICYLNKYNNKYNHQYTENDYVNIGPGASAGFKRILTDSLTKKQEIEFCEMLKDMSKEKLSQYGDFKYLHWDKRLKEYNFTDKCNITQHQIEFWACELNKYIKMNDKTGKQRKLYQPSLKKDFYLY